LGGWEHLLFCGKCETLPTLISSISWNKAVTTTVEGCYVVSTTDPTPQDGLLLTTTYDITLQMLQIVVGRARNSNRHGYSYNKTVSCVYVYLF
jgi:hypothetical protein